MLGGVTEIQSARSAKTAASNPAAASTISARATCEATSTRRTRRWARPSVPERLSARRGDERSNLRVPREGTTPNNITVNPVTRAPIANGAPANSIRSARGSPAGARR